MQEFSELNERLTDLRLDLSVLFNILKLLHS